MKKDYKKKENFMGKFIDLTGQQFGRWTVIKKGHKGTEWY